MKTSRSGRPEKTFEEGSAKTKRRRVEKLLQSHSAPELAFAARATLHSSGKRDAAAIVKQATETTSKRAQKIKKGL